jgi:pectate lyase
LRVKGTDHCATLANGAVSLATCGGAGQELRLQVLGSSYLSVSADAGGQCWNVTSGGLKLADCTNAPEQQLSYAGSATDGYTLTSFSSKQALTSTFSFGATGARFDIVPVGKADPLAVVVDERAIGWATMAADVIVPDTTPPNGDEKTRKAKGTTGGGSWQAAVAQDFANVVWFKPADFTGSNRDTSAKRLSDALAGTTARIVLFEAGNYDLALTMAVKESTCQGTCTNGAHYTEIGGFCDCNKVSCTSSGYDHTTRSIDLGSNKTLIGLGAGATFSHFMMRAVRNGNLILRNLAFTQLPGDVRAWDDALLFYPADHVWLDHLSFSGFGRGSVVLSGTRVTDGDSFYTYRDSGWMTFSWLSIDASEPWRCSGSEDSPYPFFTTNDPGLTFAHVKFKAGGGRNPAIDGEDAHFINTAWEKVTDGLDGRGNAKLRVEGCYFDGKTPVRMDDPKPPTVYAPWDAAKLTDKRLQNIFSATAWPALLSDWGNRNLNTNTLNTNSVPVAPYPYSLDDDPTKVLTTVTASAGVGKGGFPACAVNTADKSDYACP